MLLLQIFDFELSREDMKAIQKLDKNVRIVGPTAVRNGYVLRKPTLHSLISSVVIFTARCTIVQSAVLRSHVVRL